MIRGEDIGRAVYDAIIESASTLRPDVLQALRDALGRERSPRGREALSQLIENARIAHEDRVPLCQDTGSVWVAIEVGRGESLPADLDMVIDAAVADAYVDGALRMSLAREPLFDRGNTGDNTPAFVEVGFRDRPGVTVHVMLKGGGSDNASALTMLAPGEGLDGVVRFVVETVARSGAAACPPLLVGVGIGATFDKVAGLSKRALLREVGTGHPHAELAELERRLHAEIDDLGIGPAGFGGTVTALAVHVVTAPCHIASLPVAVNLGCSAVRTATIEIA